MASGDQTAPVLDLVRRSAFPAVGTALVIAGGAFALQPVVAVALVGAGLYFVLCLTRPDLALGAYLFVHIAFPVYIRIPGAGVTPSIGMLATLAAASGLSLVGGVRGRPLGGRERWFLGLFLSFAAVSLLSLLDPRTTGDSLNMWIKAFAFPAIALWIIVRSLDDETDVERMFDIMLAAACLTAAYGICEYAVGSNYLLENFFDPASAEKSMYQTGDVLGPMIGYRAFSVSSQPIEFGSWLSMIYPYALIRFARAPSWNGKALYGAAATLLVLGVLATFSRGCMLAIAAATIVLPVIYRPLRPWLAAAVIAFAAGLAFVWPFISDQVADRAGDVQNVTLRFKLWQTAFAIFGDRPLTGVGFGNFPMYQHEAIRSHLIGPFNEFGQGDLDTIGVAESAFFQLAAETGIVGLGAYAAMIGAFFTFAIGAARAELTGSRRDLLIGISIGAAAYLVNALTITAYTHFIITLLLHGAMFGFLLVVLRAIRSELQILGRS